ncbi:methylenetetrahydrofolate reductase [NAD(P)H] [Candidatus Syntrophocurvum alkaliphilum]|nr:methylenetetrahydrofolate reductase [NAD(P)H] [Candidatus Syntrophocurvum alkaliphilum]
MKIVEMYESKKPVLSLEIFPPKMDYPLETVFKTLDELKKLNPKYISVTYGAGGSNRGRTVEIASRIKNEYKIESLAHLTSIGHSKEEVYSILNELLNENINNIMALRGDIPGGVQEFDIKNQEYMYASDLIKDINKHSGDFGIAAAAHPDGHPECSRLSYDLNNLKQKVDSGVDFLTTQLFFDNRIYYDFIEKCTQIGINCPIVPGIMPVLNAKQIRRIIYLCGASMPAKLLILVDKYENNPEDMQKAGIEYASRQVEDLIKNGVPGVHLYTMNKSQQIAEIVQNVGLEITTK